MTFELHGNQLRLDGRRIGWVTRLASGERVFISPRRRSVHYMRIYRGWGLSKQVLEFLQDNGFTQIQLRIHKRETLISNIEDWKEHGIEAQYHGFEKQVFLPEKWFKKRQLMLSEILK